jgi:hypothetical protein
MSISQAVFFYSNFIEKSKKMKDVILALNVDISTICVDPKKVKRYLKGNKWGITQVPSLLLIGSIEPTSTDFKVLVNSQLDQWFSELIDNVKALETPLNPESGEFLRNSTNRVSDSGFTPLEIPEETEPEPIANNPGYVSSAIIQKAPKVPDSETTTLKQIKKDNISPTELAKQMASQREQFDEQIQEERPFGV